MPVWVIAAACFLGAAFMSFTAIWLRLRWPLAVLSLLLAAIAMQLFLAAKGQNGFHDLAAIRAQSFTVVPAIAGIAASFAVATALGFTALRRDLSGLIIVVGLLIAVGAVAASLLI